MEEIKAFVAGLPHLPGVYRMIGDGDEVLYVGKAHDLRKRVSSYFQKADHAPRIAVMLGQVRRVEVTVTRSEAEALLLENHLIKSLTPRYNILYRDDKSYPYLVVTGHDYPRLGFHRGALDRRHRYFGPFPGAGAVRESIQLMQKVFRLRTCEDTVFANRSRPCLLHQIGRCTAPCVGLVTAEAYAADVREAVLFLEGRTGEVTARVEGRMLRAADELRFEDAARYRDQLRALRKVQEKQYVASGRSVDADVVACEAVAGLVCVNLVMIRGGRHLGDRSFFPDNATGADAAAVLEAFLAQHYLERPAPVRVVVDAQLDAAALEELLSQRHGRAVRISTRASGESAVWLEMAHRNARLALEQRVRQRATQEERVQALQDALGLGPVTRIECFDVSHTLGEATVAACVVYDQGAMRPGEYRRFNVATARPGDDYAAMAEALGRRYRRLVAGEGKLPDLLLIDGGRGQVNAAAAVLADLGLTELPLVGVAKGEARKPGEETLVFPGAVKPLKLGADHAGLHLVQQIRDEAHRFAIQGHRARRQRARSGSALDGVTGIGAKRRQRLLAQFGGLKGVLAASAEELAAVEGISRVLAERIWRELHG